MATTFLYGHDFYADNHKGPGFHIAEALGRERLCIQLFGGGIVPSPTIVREILSSPKGVERTPGQTSPAF